MSRTAPRDMRESAEARDALNYAFPSEELKALRRIEAALERQQPPKRLRRFLRR